MLVDSFACSSVSVMLCLTAVKLYMSGVDAEASAWNADLLLPNVMAKSHLKVACICSPHQCTGHAPHMKGIIISCTHVWDSAEKSWLHAAANKVNTA